jgi:hypothetical protein
VSIITEGLFSFAANPMRLADEHFLAAGLLAMRTWRASKTRQGVPPSHSGRGRFETNGLATQLLAPVLWSTVPAFFEPELGEAALKADMNGEALITIHIEPEDKAKLAGMPVL